MAKIVSIEEHRRKPQGIRPPYLERKIHFHPLPWEDPAEIDAVIADLEQRFPPQNYPERSMLDNLIHSAWKLRRLAKFRADALVSGGGRNLKSLERSIVLARQCHASSLRSLKLLRSMTRQNRKVR